MKIGVCGDCNRSLIKAIDTYIAKANDDLSEHLKNAGYANAKSSVKKAAALEESISEILTEQTDDIVKTLLSAATIADALDALDAYFEEDETRTLLEIVFREFYEKNISTLSTIYMQETEGDMVVSQIRKRTSAWVNAWSEELSDIMQLGSHEQIGKLITSSIDEGESVEDLKRKLIEDGIRNVEYRARATSLTEMLRAHSVAKEEAIIQSPAVVKKEWLHTGRHNSTPRQNHIDMNGQVVDKTEPFTLTGADGTTYHPRYPRDSILPAKESVNCHCIHVAIVNDDVLGLSLEEREALQNQIISDDDGEWEKELDAANKAKAGIDEDNINMDWLRSKSKDNQIKYLGGKSGGGRQRQALIETGIVTNDKELEQLYKRNSKGVRTRKTLQELRDDGIFTVGTPALKHSTVGNFTGIRNPKKPAGGVNGGNMKGGGHSQANLDELSALGIDYSVEKTYDNGVRIGGVANHNEKEKKLGKSGQSWFPEEWDDDKVMLAGTYTSNKPAITEDLYDKDGNLTGYKKFQKYDGVTVGIFEDTEHKIGTIFPDVEQREVDD